MIDEINWDNLIQPELPFNEEKPEQIKIVSSAAGLPFYPNPKNDNERLLNYQKRFKEGDEKALELMYKLSEQICGKFISNIAKFNRYVKGLTADERKIKAQEAASYIPTQYTKNTNFVIKKNFPGYLFLRVQHELFYVRKVDKIVDFVDWDTFKERQLEELETQENDLDEKKYIIIRPRTIYSKCELMDLLRCNEKELEAAIESGSSLFLYGEKIEIDEA